MFGHLAGPDFRPQPELGQGFERGAGHCAERGATRKEARTVALSEEGLRSRVGSVGPGRSVLGCLLWHGSRQFSSGGVRKARRDELDWIGWLGRCRAGGLLGFERGWVDVVAIPGMLCQDSTARQWAGHPGLLTTRAIRVSGGATVTDGRSVDGVLRSVPDGR